LRSALALKRHENLIAEAQNQLENLTNAVEKARQDSIAQSVPLSSVALQTSKAIDSIIAFKEREINELRRQREKARQDALAEKQKQTASLSAAHQGIMNQRMALQRKQSEISSLKVQRGKLQADSSAALLRVQSAVQSSGAEISRQNLTIAGKKEGLAATQQERNGKAQKLKTMGEEPPVAAAMSASGAGGGSGNAETAQKLMEEIYVLIGSDKIDEAVSRFNAGQSLLLENITAEAFQVLKYAVDQAQETRKKNTEKK
jgi:hypothetical protein